MGEITSLGELLLLKIVSFSVLIFGMFLILKLQNARNNIFSGVRTPRHPLSHRMFSIFYDSRLVSIKMSWPQYLQMEILEKNKDIFK